MSGDRTFLALDTSSPVVSVAVADARGTRAVRSVPQRQSSPVLLRLVNECLEESGFGLADLDGAVALRGPGSFTGLRVGLATLLGLHQALRLPATALPTLEILALAAGDAPRRVLSVVNALRGEWFCQLFHRENEGLVPFTEPQLLPARELAKKAPALCVGFGAETLRESLPEHWELTFQEPGPLAPVAAVAAATTEIDWDPSCLTSPLYLRGAPVTPPKKPKRVIPV